MPAARVRKWLRALRNADADSDATMLWFGLSLACGYFCVYFWRYPVFVVPNMPAVSVGSRKEISLKTLLALSQTLGFLFAKFPAIRVVTAMDRSRRFVLLSLLCLLGVLGVGVGFGAAPSPWLQATGVFLAALPSSWIWGVLMTYTEGRRSTEVLNSVMSVLLVFAGGASRAVGAAVSSSAPFDSTYSAGRWMPLVVGGTALLPALLLFKIVDSAPAPSQLDEQLRAERKSMNMRHAWTLFVQIWPGVVCVMIGYGSLTAIRAFRDFFASDIYTAALGKPPPSIFYIVADLPAALLSGACLSLLRRVTDNKRAVLVMHALMLVGTVMLLVSAVLMDDRVFGWSGGDSASIAGYTWAISVGCAIYLAYLPQGAMLYDRILAARRDVGTGVFLIFASDLVGYVGSITLLMDNAVSEVNQSTSPQQARSSDDRASLRYFVSVCYICGFANLVVFSLALWYWWTKLPRGLFVEEKSATDLMANEESSTILADSTDASANCISADSTDFSSKARLL